MDEEMFPVEEVETIVKNAITATLGDNSYLGKKVDNWMNDMVDAALKELQSLNRPFKYAITCIIMQKTGAGMDSGAAMVWDSAKDGMVTIPWENPTMQVVFTVFGTSLNVDNPAEMD